MTNAPDFNLDDELSETSDWDTDDQDSDELDSRYADSWADEPDPEEADELTGGDHDLAERHALRRVVGLSTELEDITEVEYRQLRLERVVLAGVWTEGSAEDAENSLRELAVTWTAEDRVLLTGPAVLVAAGEVPKSFPADR